MRTRFWTVAAVALLCLAAPTARAAVTFGAGVYGAYNTYKMTDVNTFVDTWNELRTTAGASSDLKHISSGMTGGIELRAWPNSSWLVSAGWEPIFAEQEDTKQTTDIGGGTTVDSHVRLNLDASVFSGSLAYFLPSQSKGRIGFGGGVDYIRIKGQFEQLFVVTPPDPNIDNVDQTNQVSGNQVGFHFNALGEWMVSPGFGVTAGAGYRIAKVKDTKFDKLSSNPKSETDYSGFIGRVGLVFYLPGGEK